MKFLLIIPLFLTSYLHAQQTYNLPIVSFSDEYYKQFKQTRPYNKAIGDTIYYEDFSDSLLTAWTIHDALGQNYNWLWTDTVLKGQNTSSTRALYSSTTSNGFIMFPSDYYNTNNSPTTNTYFTASITSKAIPIQPSQSLRLSFDSYYGLMNNQNGELTVEVSSDSINWLTEKVNNGLFIYFSYINGHFSMNVSPVLANQDTAYIRLTYRNSSRNFWMIDDIIIEEIEANNIQVEKFGVRFSDTFRVNPVYYQVPLQGLDSLGFFTINQNLGTNPLRNTRANLTVNRDSNGVSNLVFNNTISGKDSIVYKELDTIEINTPKFLPSSCGEYIAQVLSTSDSVNQSTENSSNYKFVVSDTVYAKDTGDTRFHLSLEWTSSGGYEGDIMATHYVIKKGGKIKGVNLRLANVQSNLGIGIKPICFLYTPSPSPNSNLPLDSFLTILGTSANDYYITNADLGNRISLNFDTALQVTDNIQVIIGVELSDTTANKNLAIGVDNYLVNRYFEFSNYIYFENSFAKWWTSSAGFAIRMNMDYNVNDLCSRAVITKVEEEENKNKLRWNIYPNPTSENFKININAQSYSFYTLREIHGKLICRGKINQQKETLVDCGVIPGVYFVSVESKHGIIDSKKLVVYQ